MKRIEEMLFNHNIGHLPIVEDGVARGMISSRDIMTHQLSQADALARHRGAVLDELERQFPGITDVNVHTDATGRYIF